MLRQLQFEEPAPLDETSTPPELVRLVRQAMSKIPSDRPNRVQDLLGGINRFRRAQRADVQPAMSNVPLEVQQRLAREERRRRLLVQQSLDRAAAAIDDSRFDEAEAAIQEAEALEPSLETIRELRLELAQARQATGGAVRVGSGAGESIVRARSMFRRGRYDEAVAYLRETTGAHSLTAAIEAEPFAARPFAVSTPAVSGAGMPGLPTAPGKGTASDGGVLAQVNEWWLRRRQSSR